jgi:hypothetical protein
MKKPHEQATKSHQEKSAEMERLIKPLRGLATLAAPGPKGRVSPLSAEVASVLEAAEGSAYPTVPSLAAERFNRFAEHAVLRFHAGPQVGTGHAAVFIQPVPEVEVGILSGPGQSVHGYWAFMLAYGYFMNTERDRLRRCAVCRRWFVDVTKNRSARRCSRPCTIRWSNKQRPTKGGAR